MEVVEVPLELVRPTVRDAIGAPEITPLELTVNGNVKVNWLPKAFDAVVPYQVVNAVPSWTVAVVDPRVVVVVGVNVNSALVISRGVE